MRRVTGAVAVVVLLAVAIGTVGIVGEDATERTTAPEEGLVSVTSSESLWPYTSRSQSPDGRTLTINLLVREDPAAVGRTLEGLADQDWEPTNESIEAPGVTVPAGTEEVELAWRSAHGATRYTYVERDGEGRWLGEYRQLHDGTYLATRDHARLYALPDGENWTAAQIHREY